MKKVVGIIVVGVIIVFLVIGILHTRKREDVQSIAGIQRQEGIPVLTVKAEPGTVVNKRSFYGTVRAADQTSVSSKLMERIDRIPVKVGEKVEKDQVLVKFDTTASQAAIVQQRLAMENAGKEYERMQALFDKGAISRQVLDQVKLGYDISLENYQTARRAVELMAPVAGIVSRIDYVEGDIAMPGDVIMTIVSSRKLEITFEVTAEDRRLLKNGQRVSVRLDSEEGIDGRITEISLATGDDSRMFPVCATIPAAAGFFPGLLATVDVTLMERKDVLSAPADAVLDRGDKPFVIVVEDGIAHMKTVEIGLRGEKNIEIISGLNEGEVIAVYGHKTLEEGNKVKIVEE